MRCAILIVDDEADLAAGCARLLRRQGWQVQTAATRAAALAAVGGAPRPTLAIVECHLPDGDGLDVVRAASSTGTPAIVITGRTSAAARQVAIEEGAAAFLGKPFSSQALVDLVRAIVGRPHPSR